MFRTSPSGLLAFNGLRSRNASRWLSSGNQYRRPSRVTSWRGSPRTKSPEVANAVQAESLLGDVGHRIALGLFGKAPASLIACEQKKMTLEEYAPSRVAGLRFAEVQLGHRACALVRRHVTVGLLAKQVLHRR